MTSPHSPFRPTLAPDVAARLRSAIRGEVLTDPMSMGLYATDASMFQIWPLAVVVPLDRNDAVAAVRIAGEAGVPILPRGGGTSLSGQTIAQAVVIDVSKNMNRLLELNVEERWARVEPGLVRDELNAMLKPHGLQFAPDPATSNRANVGGMIANNAAGMRSIRYGTTIDHLLGVDVILGTGEVLNLGPLDAAGWAAKTRLQDREGAIYRGFEALIDTHRDEIIARFPKVRRRSGGYMLDAFTGEKPWNLARIMAASEGTLGFVLEATVRLEPLPRVTGLCVAHFAEMAHCLRAVVPIVGHAPSAVELLDGLIVRLAKESRLTRERLGFIEGEPAAILIIEADGETPGAVRAQLEAIAADLRQRGLAYATPVLMDAASIADAWLARTNGLGLMTTVKGDRKPVPFIEDAAVPLEHLADYIEEVVRICARHGRSVGLFAHASVGLLHVRPLLDLHDQHEIHEFKAIQDEVFEVVCRVGGSWSGEHGDGLVRGAYNERFFGSRLYGAFKELKRLFDPAGLMNPGKIVDTPPVDQNLDHTRYMPGYRMQYESTMFHYRADGGMRQTVEQCTGTGVCRKTLGGVMCPSYRVTRDEEHSTRGRANALRLAMTGQLGAEGLASDRLRAVFDLCISCKACVSECPNSVDVTKLKAEVLHRHHEHHGSTLRDKIFRDLPVTARLASGPLAPLANAVMGAGPVRWAMDRFVGIDARRPLPRYARERLSTWFTRRAQPADAAQRPVVALFNDTYLEHFEPWVGRAAVEVLEGTGFRVELATVGCCQRPALSKGFLETAKTKGAATLRKLDAWAARDIPIVVCEPSCASSLTDDLPDLIDDEALGQRVAGQIQPIDQFLGALASAGTLRLNWKPGGAPRAYLVHGHCHQKALTGTNATLALLRAIPGARVELIDDGCCGMAGSFGYEKEHYAWSVKMAEDRMLPAIRATGGAVALVASGMSCRHQIGDLTGRRAVHVIEAVRAAMD